MVPIYSHITDAATDCELIRFWFSQKSKTTQKTYIMVVKQFLEFSGKELRDTVVEDILLWLESYQLRQASANTIHNKLAALTQILHQYKKNN